MSQAQDKYRHELSSTYTSKDDLVQISCRSKLELELVVTTSLAQSRAVNWQPHHQVQYLYVNILFLISRQIGTFRKGPKRNFKFFNSRLIKRDNRTGIQQRAVFQIFFIKNNMIVKYFHVGINGYWTPEKSDNRRHVIGFCYNRIYSFRNTKYVCEKCPLNIIGSKKYWNFLNYDILKKRTMYKVWNTLQNFHKGKNLWAKIRLAGGNWKPKKREGK